MVDAPTVTVRAALREAWPGTGDAAAMKVHTVRSVGGGAPVQSHVRPAREPESRPLEVHESWRGDGLRAALADASLARLRACDAHAGPCGIRRQDHCKPKVA